MPRAVRWLRGRVGEKDGRGIILSPYDFNRFADALDKLPHNIMLGEPAFICYSLDGKAVLFDNRVKRNEVRVVMDIEKAMA